MSTTCVLFSLTVVLGALGRFTVDLKQHSQTMNCYRWKSRQNVRSAQSYWFLAVHGLHPRVQVVLRERLQRQLSILLGRAERDVEAEASLHGVGRATPTRHERARFGRELQEEGTTFEISVATVEAARLDHARC